MSQQRSKEVHFQKGDCHLLDIDEAAKRLNISNHTVRSLVQQRKITFVKLGARVLFRSQDLDDFIQSRLVQAQDDPQEDKV